MFNKFVSENVGNVQVNSAMIFILAAALLLSFQGIALAIPVPAADTFIYDVYDIGVNKILKGAPGFVIGVGTIAWGGSHMLKSQVPMAIMSIIGGGIILKADSMVTTLGMSIF